MASYVVRMIALGYGIGEDQVLPMLKQWRQGFSDRPDGDPLTYEQIAQRLLDEKGVQASPQRLAELILDTDPERERATRVRKDAPA